MTQRQRSFLFLQGVCSPFFQRLGRRLSEDGHRVTKVHFNAGDMAYWSPSSGESRLFRGRLSELPDYLQDLRQRHEVTDQLIFGDERPVHRTAIRDARHAGVRNHILEEGYFRPWWITLEREGVNGHSLLPLEAAWFCEAARRLPALPKPHRFHCPFRLRAKHDVQYHLAGLGNPILAPHYRNHATVTAPIEYAGYLKRFTQLRWWRRRDAERIRALIEGQASFYVLPLQLNGDAQIRHHSPFSGMEEVIDHVMSSFARHAPGDSLLCIKNHPLDMGLENYAGKIQRLARRYGVQGRIVYLEAGDLNILLEGARGTVTVNSTSGIVALEHRCPTIALSRPIYRLPGLTFEGSLDDFWRHAEPPDDSLFRCFHKVVMHTTQLNGGYYCQTGIDLAVDNVARRLEAEVSPLETLL